MVNSVSNIRVNRGATNNYNASPNLITGFVLIVIAMGIFIWTSEAYSGKPYRMAPAENATGDTLKWYGIISILAYVILIGGLIFLAIAFSSIILSGTPLSLLIAQRLLYPPTTTQNRISEFFIAIFGIFAVITLFILVSRIGK